MALNGAVLIVDDDPGIRSSLRRLLEGVGYAVLIASDGEEGLRVLRSPLQVGLVLLDVLMPVMNGLELLEQKNSDPKLREIPVLLITAREPTAHPSGVHRILPKPLNTVELLLELERLDA